MVSLSVPHDVWTRCPCSRSAVRARRSQGHLGLGARASIASSSRRLPANHPGGDPLANAFARSDHQPRFSIRSPESAHAVPR